MRSVSIAAEKGSMEKFGTRKKTRERFLVSGLFMRLPMLGDAGIFVAWKILFGLSVCDIRMDSSDRKEISHCDIARQKAVRPRFPAFVRKATVFTVSLTLSDKNCRRYATFAKRAPGLCLPIATLSVGFRGVGKRQVDGGAPVDG